MLFFERVERGLHDLMNELPKLLLFAKQLVGALGFTQSPKRGFELVLALAMFLKSFASRINGSVQGLGKLLNQVLSD